MAKPLNYKKLLEEYEININDLPSEIKKKINVMAATIGKHNATPTKGTEDAVVKQDLAITDLIAQYIEDHSEEEEEEEQEKTPKKGKNKKVVAEEEEEEEELEEEEEEETPVVVKKKVAVATPAPVVVATPAPVAIPEPKKAKFGFGTLAMEEAVIAECGAHNGIIESRKLADILGKTVFGLAAVTQEVFSIKLRKIYGHAQYTLLKD